MKLKLGTLIVLSYLALFLCASAFMLYCLTVLTKDSALSGIYVIALTMPWSLMSTPLLDTVGYINWYGQFAESPLLYGLFALAPLTLCAALNTYILHIVARAGRTAIRG